MDDSEDDLLLEAYQSYTNVAAQETAEDELLLEAYENYVEETKPGPTEDELLLEAYENYIEETNPEPTEDEFLLKAYQDYANEIVEWPNFCNEEAYNIFRGDQAKPMPLLIRECARLIPTVSKKKETYVDFHPFNMPQNPIKSINVIGTIVGRQINKRYLDIKVYDGTGTLTVLYKLEKFEIDRKRRRDINRKHGVLETDVEGFTRLMSRTIVPDKSKQGLLNPAAQRIQRFQREYSLWWNECERGMLGTPLKVGSYVSILGFCNLKRNNSRRDQKSNNFWDTGHLPALIFNAYAIKSISEKEYNRKLQEWLKGVFAIKYSANKQ